MPRKRNPTPYQTLATLSALRSAWKHIYDNRHSSKSEKTKKAIDKFEEKENLYLGQIYRALKERRYRFEGAKAVVIDDRPLVVSTAVRDRVVQRALLETLQALPQIKPFIQSPNSFGAVEDGGVKKAALAYLNSIRNGATYFYKSDIQKFFTKVALPKVFKCIEPIVNDPEFMDLLRKATNLEIKNLEELGDYKKYFDFNEVGTPQGCCLSPLLGNILLNEFDREMNQQKIVCLRYLDDFLILGPSESLVQKAFNRAKRILARDKLIVYEAHLDPKKAKTAALTKRFEYLGLDICGESIRPNGESRNKLFTSIKNTFQESLKVNFETIKNGSQEKHSLVKTLTGVSNRLKGWGNQYFFCNDDAVLTSLDTKISELIRQYLGAYKNQRDRLKEHLGDSSPAERRLLGVHLLVDSKKRPKEFHVMKSK